MILLNAIWRHAQKLWLFFNNNFVFGSTGVSPYGVTFLNVYLMLETVFVDMISSNRDNRGSFGICIFYQHFYRLSGFLFVFFLPLASNAKFLLYRKKNFMQKIFHLMLFHSKTLM